MRCRLNKWVFISALIVYFISPGIVRSQLVADKFPAILSVREQEQSVLQITQKRLEQLIPGIMEETGFDMWIIACNEDNLDPVYKTMVPFKMWCPITQILVFYNHGPGNVERLNISRTNLDGLFTNEWDYRAFDNKQGESQWECLKRIVHGRDPQKIGVNIGKVQWAAGGLTVALLKKIEETLGGKYAGRMASSEEMATMWGMTMLDEEIELMERAQAISHTIIAETFSNRVITPGITTIDDLKFHYWQRVTDLGLDIGAHPTFRIKGRKTEDIEKYGKDDKLIRPGDFLLCDVVLKYMRYYTDHAEWAYVLRQGENDVPDFYKKLMAEGNRLQDIFCEEFRDGLTGNELLTNILRKALVEGIPSPKVYSHSIGYFLHETGPLIGLPWEQVNIPGRGDVRLAGKSCYAAELSVSMPISGQEGKTFTLPLEQIVFFNGIGMVFLDGRQTRFHVVR